MGRWSPADVAAAAPAARCGPRAPSSGEPARRSPARALRSRSRTPQARGVSSCSVVPGRRYTSARTTAATSSSTARTRAAGTARSGTTTAPGGSPTRSTNGIRVESNGAARRSADPHATGRRRSSKLPAGRALVLSAHAREARAVPALLRCAALAADPLAARPGPATPRRRSRRCVAAGTLAGTARMASGRARGRRPSSRCRFASAARATSRW